MKIILVAGGSGGHIYPCLELAKHFRENDNEVLLCGSNNSLEEKIYKSNNFDFKGLDVNRKKIKSFFKNKNKIKIIYDEFNPDAIILFGNYISVSFALVAIYKKIPIYLHEQNVIYGNANKLLGIKAKKIYLSLPIKKDIYHKKSLLFGNPKSDINNTCKLLNKSKNNVVIVMGSLGSATVNKTLKEFIRICNGEVEYHIVVGSKYYESFTKDLKVTSNIHLYPYLDNLSSYIKECDVFVSRAGATTISEILSLGACSILVPSPYVKNNHQYHNAQYLLDNNACILIEESKLNANILNVYINDLIKDYDKRKRIRDNALKLAVLDSKKKIYEDILNDYKG